MQKEGIVLTKTNGFYYVESDNITYECRIRGILKRDKKNKTCIVGDRVIFCTDEKVILSILPRKNMINRPLLANLDILVICMAAKDPELDFNMLNLLLLNAFYYKVKPLVVINKIDLLDSESLSILESKLLFLKNIDIDYIFISVEKFQNIDTLCNYFKESIIAFSGPSGAGKSSLINLLQDEETLETSTVSKKIKRGRHTTKISKLLHLKDSGYVIDTPGFSTIDLPDINDLDEYISLFPEFEKYLGQCQFRDCVHINEPNCKIKELVKTNPFLDKRYEFYKTNYQVLIERWKNYYD